MRAIRRVGAFGSGLLLYSGAVGLSGLLVDLRLPREVYVMLGGRGSATVVIAEATVIALVLFLLALPWGYLTVKPLKRGRRPTTAWCVAGLAIAWLAWLVYGAVNFSLAPKMSSLPLLSLLLSSSTPPLWGVLNTIGVLAAVLLAGVLARRVQLQQKHQATLAT
jgi:hypothetical protein